jgi:hypothetical protein
MTPVSFFLPLGFRDLTPQTDKTNQLTHWVPDPLMPHAVLYKLRIQTPSYVIAIPDNISLAGTMERRLLRQQFGLWRKFVTLKSGDCVVRCYIKGCKSATDRRVHLSLRGRQLQELFKCTLNNWFEPIIVN